MATDEAIKSAIQESSSDEAALATAITDRDLTAMDQYIEETHDDAGVVNDLCYQ
ncbi:hypothetical protein NKH77_17315 [Streptomyces sp. M19]